MKKGKTLVTLSFPYLRNWEILCIVWLSPCKSHLTTVFPHPITVHSCPTLMPSSDPGRIIFTRLLDVRGVLMKSN